MEQSFPTCPECNTNDYPRGSKGLKCVQCNTKRATNWAKQNPERHFFNQIKARYGLSKNDYLAMVERQNNKCAICFNEESSVCWGKVRKLAIDHDHKTGAVRGLLCFKCNIALGKVQDNKQILLNMIAYLEEHSES